MQLGYAGTASGEDLEIQIIERNLSVSAAITQQELLLNRNRPLLCSLCYRTTSPINCTRVILLDENENTSLSQVSNR
jgi:hypothetical protein